MQVTPNWQNVLVLIGFRYGFEYVWLFIKINIEVLYMYNVMKWSKMKWNVEKSLLCCWKDISSVHVWNWNICVQIVSPAANKQTQSRTHTPASNGSKCKWMKKQRWFLSLHLSNTNIKSSTKSKNNLNKWWKLRTLDGTTRVSKIALN